MTSHGLCVLKADKCVVYSDLKNLSLAFSIYFQGLCHLRALTEGKEKGKVQINSINKPWAEIWRCFYEKRADVSSLLDNHGAGRGAGLPKETRELTPGRNLTQQLGRTPGLLSLASAREAPPGSSASAGGPDPLLHCSGEERRDATPSFSGRLPPYAAQASTDAGLLLLPVL